VDFVSTELAWVFCPFTPNSGSRFEDARGLTSSFGARSLIRISYHSVGRVFSLLLATKPITKPANKGASHPDRPASPSPLSRQIQLGNSSMFQRFPSAGNLLRRTSHPRRRPNRYGRASRLVRQTHARQCAFGDLSAGSSPSSNCRVV